MCTWLRSIEFLNFLSSTSNFQKRSGFAERVYLNPEVILPIPLLDQAWRVHSDHDELFAYTTCEEIVSPLRKSCYHTQWSYPSSKFSIYSRSPTPFHFPWWVGISARRAWHGSHRYSHRNPQYPISIQRRRLYDNGFPATRSCTALRVQLPSQ